MKFLSHLMGIVIPSRGTSRTEERAAPTPPMQIEGAHNAPQLAMLCKDANLPSGPQLEAIVRAHAKPAKRIVQAKLDGIRALYIGGRIVTREGTPLDCALHCQPGLARLEEAADMGPLFFDGEYVAQDGFSATLSEQRRGEGEGVFWIFDYMPMSAWKAGRWDMPIEHRLGSLEMMVTKHCDSNFVGMLNRWELTPEETVAKCRELWAEGAEGVVSKRMGSPYVRDRSEDWLRIKETITVDGVITDMMGRDDGTLKAMNVRTERYGNIKVGTGWGRDQGIALLALHQHAVNNPEPQWVEISFQRSAGTVRAVRGAKLHRLRDRKGTFQ